MLPAASAEKTVPSDYVNSCTGKIENTHLLFLSGRKIVFKNTLLNLRVCSKVESVCTVRQYLHDHPAVIIFEIKVSLLGIFFSTKRRLGCIIKYLLC